MKCLAAIVIAITCSAASAAEFRSDRGFTATFPAGWKSMPSSPHGLKTDDKPWLFFLEGPFDGVGGRKVLMVGLFGSYSAAELSRNAHFDVLKYQLEKATTSEKVLRKFADGFVTEHPINAKQTRLEAHRVTKQGDISITCYCAPHTADQVREAFLSLIDSIKIDANQRVEVLTPTSPNAK